MSQHEPEPHSVAELAALYAAGALSPDECQVFERRLESGCAASAAALKQLDPVVLALTDAVPAVTPPSSIRANVLKAIASNPAGDPGPTSPPRMVIQRAFEALWEETSLPGVRRRVLLRDRQRRQVTVLLRMAAGASYPSHVHDGPEECLVLEGDLRIGAQVLREGDYQYAPPGSVHDRLSSETGCLALVIAPLREELAAER